MEFGSILNALLVVTTLIAGALAALQRGLYTNLREANKDLRDRDTDRDKQLADLETENTALKADLDAAGRMIRNEAQIAALQNDIHDNHAETRVFYSAQTELGKQMLDALHRLSGGS